MSFKSVIPELSEKSRIDVLCHLLRMAQEQVKQNQEQMNRLAEKTKTYRQQLRKVLDKGDEIFCIKCDNNTQEFDPHCFCRRCSIYGICSECQTELGFTCPDCK